LKDGLPSTVLKAANLIPLNHDINPSSAFIEAWEVANQISSQELNPRKSSES